MAFTEITADELNIYGVMGGGALVWYRDTFRNGTNAADGSTGWSPASGSAIGQGWDQYKHVFAGGGGILYAITDDGELIWYKDTLRNGTNGPAGATGWAANSGAQIGAGWQAFSQVIYGGDGIIYAIRPTGELLYYKDVARNGTNGPNGTSGWGTNSGHQIGAGWNNFRLVFSGGGGVLYGVTPAGTLHYYKDVFRNGTNAANGSTGWGTGSGNQIGAGWQNFPTVCAPGASDGIIYAATVPGELRYYKDVARNGTNGPNGTSGWGVNSGHTIGHGWSIGPRTMVTGYPVPMSTAPGGSVALKLSALTATSGMVQVVRLKENADGSVGVPVGSASALSVPNQAVPVDAWQHGCGWTTTATVTVDPSWQSGYYAARVTTTEGRVVDLVFTVKPGAVRKDFLLLANTNCWNSYNGWGGVSNYNGYADVVQLSFQRPNPETVTRANFGGVYQWNHLTAAEIWFSTWLENNGYQFDVCTDFDLHQGDPVLTGYKGVILSTHPEYWSFEMAQKLKAYVDGGGRVLYLGGNGIFRNVTFAADGSSMTTGSAAPYYAANAWTTTIDTRTLLGVGYDISKDQDHYNDRSPYVVDIPSHPFLAGTGLTAGALVGAQGRNGGGACGWEVDCATDSGDGNGPPPANLQVIAHGQIAYSGYTGNMTYYDTAAGGFVFSVGSISFCGSVPVDTNLAKIVKNALNACLAPAPLIRIPVATGTGVEALAD
jgi:N,N-dimethylformamidase beta subunit-like protein/tachylectin